MAHTIRFLKTDCRLNYFTTEDDLPPLIPWRADKEALLDHLHSVWKQCCIPVRELEFLGNLALKQRSTGHDALLSC